MYSVDSYSQPHTDTKNWNLAGKVSNRVSADTRVGGGMARTRADNELSWVLFYQLFNGDLVISKNMNYGTLKNQVLINIPGKGVVVINENKIRCRCYRW